MSFINTILDPIFGPILFLDPFLGIIIISFLVSLLMSIIYKYMTNQNQMKQFKDDIKKYQKEMKEEKQNPQKMMEIQKKAMEVNMQYMMQSLKPTLVTFIPIIIIFAWLSSHFAYEPITPQTTFDVTIELEKEVEQISISLPKELEIVEDNIKKPENKVATFSIKPQKEGEYLLTFNVEKTEYNKDVLITNRQKYVEPTKAFNDGVVKEIRINQKQLKILNLFGWQLGWIGSYIIFSIVFSLIIRKVMKLN
ncbi:MAG: EMC3/TMCO1 family protein [Candidatus Woesearchaeota archaeon]